MTPRAELSFVHRFVPGGNPDVALLLLHGTGGDENDLVPVGQQLLPGAPLLSPRGRVLEHGMPRFFRRIAEGVFDQKDLKIQTDELARFIMEASDQYDLKDRKVIAVGYSNGANIAGSLLLSHPKVLAGAVLLRPMVPFVPQTSPDLREVPVLLGSGKRDPIADPRQTSELAKIFQSAGARVTLHWHPGGHELGQDDLLAAKQWLAEFPRS